MTCKICRKEWPGGHFPQECRDTIATQRDKLEHDLALFSDQIDAARAAAELAAKERDEVRRIVGECFDLIVDFYSKRLTSAQRERRRAITDKIAEFPWLVNA